MSPTKHDQNRTRPLPEFENVVYGSRFAYSPHHRDQESHEEGDEDYEDSQDRRSDLGGGGSQVWGTGQFGEGNRERIGREEG